MTNAADPRVWRRLAACRGLDPDIFFPTSEDEAGPAKSVCGTCSVREACLEWALTSGEEGVWGGLTERERRRLRRGGLAVTLAEETPSMRAPTQADLEAVSEFLERLEHAAIGERFAQVGRLPAHHADLAVKAAERLAPGRWSLVRRARPDGLVDVFAAAAAARGAAQRRAG
ncbi:MAG: WhiB family transcriptional regulator [Acidimicrobiales bacterium]